MIQSQFDDTRMSKRRKIINTQSILKVLNIPGLLELVYSFLMNPLEEHAFTLTKKNELVWICLRSICRMGYNWSHRLICFLSPKIDTDDQLDAWTRMVPGLQHLQVDKYDLNKETNTWIPNSMSLINLRSILFHQEFTSIGNGIKTWNCPKLEYLELLNYKATKFDVSSISSAFPLLTYLCCGFADEDFTITGFPNLIRFTFCTSGTKRLHIVNMPRLETCEFDDGYLDLMQFENVPNLKHVTSTSSGVKEVVFCDQMPILESFYFPCNEDLKIIRGNVNWKNLKSVALVYGDIWENIWFQLESIQILSIYDVFPDVWPNMQHLHTLSCSQSNSIRLQNLLCSRYSLTSLDLHWDYDSSFDIADLLCFPNISTLHLHGSGQYDHLDSVVSIPILKDLQISMHITKSEEMVVREWHESVPTRSLKAYFLNKTNSF
jgi:hypothetical protein